MIAESVDDIKYYIRGVLSKSIHSSVETSFSYRGKKFSICATKSGRVKLTCGTGTQLFEGVLMTAYIVDVLAKMVSVCVESLDITDLPLENQAELEVREEIAKEKEKIEAKN